MVASITSYQEVWLCDLLEEIRGVCVQEVVLKIDNTFAIVLVKNPVFHGQNKHIKSHFHYIHQRVEENEMRVMVVVVVGGNRGYYDNPQQSLLRISSSC